jgi:hypothetical protein
MVPCIGLKRIVYSTNLNSTHSWGIPVHILWKKPVGIVRYLYRSTPFCLAALSAWLLQMHCLFSFEKKIYDNLAMNENDGNDLLDDPHPDDEILKSTAWFENPRSWSVKMHYNIPWTEKSSYPS